MMTLVPLLAASAPDEVSTATPAIADDTLYFRTQHRIIAVGTPSP